jgi:hypothetical protein
VTAPGAPEEASGGAEALSPRRGSVQGSTASPVPEKAPAGALGLKVGGSANTGHKLTLREGTLEKIFGTDEPYQANGLLSHCLKVLKPSEADDTKECDDERGFMFSVVKDIGARDVVERMLAVQMAATHVAMIRAGRSMATCTLLNQLEAHATNYNKLARTFTTQMEALRKHRTGGKQTVVVQHVTVAEGGQAIVGHVETGGRDRGVGA